MRIAVYGATGYQAGLVLEELSRRGLETVLIGRDAARLATVGSPDAERRTAALDDPAALAGALAGCAAVINCAGPFTPTGPALARAAVAAGCHYMDTAGEQRFVESLFDAVGADAARAGVTVVPAANDGALPTDLLTHLLAEGLGPVAEVVITHLISGGGGMSRGSLRSLTALAAAGAPGPRREIVAPDGVGRLEAAPFPLVEIVTVPRHVPGARVVGLIEGALADRFAAPLPAQLIDAAPDGPAEADRAEQRFTYLVDVTAADGRVVRGVVRGPDTYGTTAVVAVEAARRLAAGGAPAGVLAAAQAFDPADFLAFLAGRGITADLPVDTGVGSPGKARVHPE
jgi:short subunit dehydrogenase-like uncharacterized protein